MGHDVQNMGHDVQNMGHGMHEQNTLGKQLEGLPLSSCQYSILEDIPAHYTPPSL